MVARKYLVWIALLAIAVSSEVSSEEAVHSDKLGFTRYPFWGSNAEVYTQATNLGLGAVRITLPWRDIDKTPFACNRAEIKGDETAQFNCSWEPYATWISDAVKHGLVVTVLILATPDWARDPQTSSCQYSSGAYPLGSTASAEAPFGAFVSAAVKRFKGQVSSWMLWSEVDTPANWCGTPALYRERVLIPGAKAVKTGDPSAIVVAPGLYVGERALSWSGIDLWLTEDGTHLAAPVDALSFDGYKDAPALLRDMDIAASYHRCVEGQSAACIKSYWIAEFGYGTLAACHTKKGSEAEIAQAAASVFEHCLDDTKCGKAFYWTMSSDEYSNAAKPCTTSVSCDFSLTDQCAAFATRPRYSELKRLLGDRLLRPTYGP